MNQDITDSSDFKLSSIPQLSQLDALLRCHICKDFLKNPVLTPCCHTFCSLCIRGYLNNQAKCPLCLHELRESMLRSEYLVNELTACFTSLRLRLLQQLSQQILPSDTISIEALSDNEKELELEIIGSKEIKSNSFASSRSSSPSIPRHGSGKSIQSMFKGQTKQDGLQMAQCPICQNFFPIDVLERSHLDECLTLQSIDNKPKKRKGTAINERPSKRVQSFPANTNDKTHQLTDYLGDYLSSSTQMDVQRLPKVNFANMTIAQIKQKLVSLNLPSHGSKQAMIARYNHFEMLWNSNFFDSMHPVSHAELRRQLVSWEANNGLNVANDHSISKMMQSAKSNNKRSYQHLLKHFKQDKFDRKGWIQLYKNEFRALIKEAKSVKRKVPENKDGSSEEQSNCDDNQEVCTDNKS